MKNVTNPGYRLVMTRVPEIPGLRGAAETVLWMHERLFPTPVLAYGALRILLDSPLGAVADPHGRGRYKVLPAALTPPVQAGPAAMAEAIR